MDEFVPTDELLMRYLDGNMDAEEKARLESRLQTDEALRNNVERLTLSVAAVQLYGLHEQVGRIGREELAAVQPAHARVVTMQSRLKRVFAAAAVLILLLGGTFAVYTANLSGSSVYESAFVDYTIANTRSEGTTAGSLVQAYQQGRYADVLELRKGLNLSAEEALLVGISQLKAGQYGEAIEQLAAISQGKGKYHQDGEFYLAMAFLKAKKYKEALSMLEAIHQNKNHLYHSRISTKDVYDAKLLQLK